MKFLKPIAVIISLVGMGFAETDNKDYKGTSSALLDAIASKPSGLGTVPVSLFRVPDPTYDQTFKMLFLGKGSVCVEDSSQIFTTLPKREPSEDAGRMLISLLNALLYPKSDGDENAHKIRSITYLPTESTTFGSVNSEGVWRFDIACRCECWGTDPKSKEVEVFDIEMQRSNVEIGFNLRLYDYGAALRRDTGLKTRVLSFLNYRPVKNPEDVKNHSVSIRTMESGHLKDSAFNLLEGATLIDTIDLRKCVSFLKTNKEIIVDKNPLGKAGREWLGLLGLVHWAEHSEGPNEDLLYAVPMADTIEIALALGKLAVVDQITLDSVRNGIKAEEEMLKAEERQVMEAEKKGREEGLEKGREEGLEKGREEGAAIGASRMAFSTMMEDFVEYGDIKIRKSAKLMPTTESELKKIWTEAGLNDDKFDEFISELKKQEGDLIASDKG